MNTLEKKSFASYKNLIIGSKACLELQQLCFLKKLGVNFEQKGDAYILADSHYYHPIYSRYKFAKELQQHIRIENIVSSTLDLQATKKYQIIIAEAQTQGRGQHGRTFYSALGRQILLTYHFPGRVRPLEGIWALWRLLAPYGALYKWPNDLYHPTGKIAGFLSSQYKDLAHVSFGLNLSLPPNSPLGSLNWLPSAYIREDIISSWYQLFCEAQQKTQNALISDLAGSSIIADNELVLFKEKEFLFKGFNNDGSVCLYDPQNLKNLTVSTGSLHPAERKEWVR